MFELSLHILDLVQNSITAGATLVRVVIVADEARNLLVILIEDDGCGMSEELLARVTSPFTTTRTTRNVGLGVPMMKQLAEACEGAFRIESQPGRGTTLEASFALNHLDRPPLGALADTVFTLVMGAPEKPDFLLELRVDDREFLFDTRQLRETLGGLPLDLPDISAWIADYLNEGIAEALGAKRV